MSVEGDIKSLPDATACSEQITLDVFGVSISGLPGGLGIQSKADTIRSLLGQMQTVLIPLQPIFDIMNAIQKIFDLAKALPDAIENGDPSAVSAALPDAVKAVAKLTKYIPQKTFIDTFLSATLIIKEGLVIFRAWLSTIQEQVQVVEQLKQEAISTGNTELTAAAAQLESQTDSLIQHAAASMCALSKPLAMLQSMNGLIPGLPDLPQIESMDGNSLQQITDALDDLIQALNVALAMMP